MGRQSTTEGGEGAGRQGERAFSVADGAALPERPARAPGVTLVGEMKGSGFEEPQWLVERSGRFIQLSELLYRVAEHADGSRTVEEIARGMTEATDRVVTGDDVRLLLQTKLVPLGLVASDSSPVPANDLPLDALLRVGMRTKTLGPAVLDPVTKVLRLFFAPPVLVPILVAIAAAHAWLYLERGVTDVLTAVVLQPALVVPLFGVFVLSGIFHELGHASALRYGGARARAMGVGFYLVYPALYTDTSESYRLGRWARIRVDLGGFYFHLIFALALMGVSLLSGEGWLLVAVLLINLEMVRQLFFPFVRFDGYWLVADLTGIPDPFTALAPFLRRVFNREGTRLPKLKPWVKRILVIYATCAIVVLGALLFLLLARLPEFLALAFHSLLVQWDGLAAALEQGRAGDAFVAAAQAVILLLPIVGLAYVLVSLARTTWATFRRRRSRTSSASALSPYA